MRNTTLEGTSRDDPTGGWRHGEGTLPGAKKGNSTLPQTRGKKEKKGSLGKSPWTGANGPKMKSKSRTKGKAKTIEK